MKIGHFSKLMKLNIHLLLCSKRHYIDEIEYPPSPICWEKPQFESNVTSFQFRQNTSAWGWPPYLLVSPVGIYFSLQIIVCSLSSLAYNHRLFKKISKNSMEYSCNFGWQSIPPSPSKRVIFRVVVELSVKPWSIKSNFCNSQPSESIRHWRRFNRPP